MANSIATTYRNAAGNARFGLLDTAGAGEPSLEIRTAADAVLLTIGLNATAAVGSFSSGVGTFNAPTTGGGSWSTFSQNPSASGTAAKAVLVDANGDDAMELTVGTSGAEVNFDSLSFDTGVAVTTTTAPTVTEPAS